MAVPVIKVVTVRVPIPTVDYRIVSIHLMVVATILFSFRLKLDRCGDADGTNADTSWLFEPSLSDTAADDDDDVDGSIDDDADASGTDSSDSSNDNGDNCNGGGCGGRIKVTVRLLLFFHSFDTDDNVNGNGNASIFEYSINAICENGWFFFASIPFIRRFFFLLFGIFFLIERFNASDVGTSTSASASDGSSDGWSKLVVELISLIRTVCSSLLLFSFDDNKSF